jgi:hypothetical protein
MVLTVIAGASALMAAATPALAGPGYIPPRTAQLAETREHRDPCHAVSNSPHELAGLQGLQDNCRRLMAQGAAHPQDTALREACNRAARALTGQPC